MSAPEKEPQDAHVLNGQLWHEHWKIGTLAWVAENLIHDQNETASNNEKLIDAMLIMMEVVGEAAAKLGDIQEGLHQRLWHDEQRRNAMQGEIGELVSELDRLDPIAGARRREKADATP